RAPPPAPPPAASTSRTRRTRPASSTRPWPPPGARRPPEHEQRRARSIDMASTFSDRDGWIWLDGEMVEWRDARCHVLNHGLHYASGIFEGIRAYGGKQFRLKAHIERLFESGRLLGYDIPFSLDALTDACHDVVSRNGLSDAYVRPFAWRGSEQMSVSAPSSRIHVGIAAWTMPAYFQKSDGGGGIRLAFSRWRRQAPTMAPLQAKAAGLYMAGTLAKHEAVA